MPQPVSNPPYNPFPTLTPEPSASAKDLAAEVARAKAREAEIAASIPKAGSFATAESVAAATQQATAASESAASAAAAAASAASRAETLAGSAVTQEAMAAASAQQTVATAAQNARIAELEAGISALRATLATLTSQLSVVRTELVVGAINAASGAGGIGTSIQTAVSSVVDAKVAAAVQSGLASVTNRLTAVENAADQARRDASSASVMVQTSNNLESGQGRFALLLDTNGVARIFPLTTTLEGESAISSEEASAVSPLVSLAQIVVNGHSLPANGTGITLTGADIQTGQFGRTLDSVLNRDGNAAVLYYRGAWQSNSNLAYGPSDANAQIGDLVVLSRQETVNSVSLPAGTAIFYDGALWKPLGGGGGGSAADASQVPMSSNWQGQPNVEAVLNEIKGDISGLMSYVGYTPGYH